MKVIEDFLSKEQFDLIQSAFMGPYFPWYIIVMLIQLFMGMMIPLYSGINLPIEFFGIRR